VNGWDGCDELESITTSDNWVFVSLSPVQIFRAEMVACPFVKERFEGCTTTVSKMDAHTAVCVHRPARCSARRRRSSKTRRHSWRHKSSNCKWAAAGAVLSSVGAKHDSPGKGERRGRKGTC